MNQYVGLSWSMAALLGIGFVLTLGVIEIGPMRGLTRRKPRPRRRLRPATPFELIGAMAPAEFEQWAVALMTRRGYRPVARPERTGPTVRYLAEKDGVAYAVIVNVEEGRVGWDDLLGLALRQDDANTAPAVLLTRGRLTVQARKLAQASGCELAERSDLARWAGEIAP